MNPYVVCPTIKTKSFTIRLISEADSKSLFRCYNDKKAVEFMNDDNCEFGFYVETVDKMQETIGYWIDYYKNGYFIRFSIVDNVTEQAVGTIEGFSGETGVLRIDLCNSNPGSSTEVETHLSSKINNYVRSTSKNEPGYTYGSWKFDTIVQFNIGAVLGIQGSTQIN